MAIITFCSNETKETGQTLSLVSIASYMAIQHNYKILIISTNFNDLSLENCFWEYDKIRNLGAVSTDKNQNAGVESGVEGLIKAIESKRTSNEIVRNYSRIVLKERLDVLTSATTTSYQEYFNNIAPYYENIIQIANKYYDLVFVDLSKKMPPKKSAEILQISDVVVMNITQRLKSIDGFALLRDNNEFYQRKNIILLTGRYDDTSKYNVKNVTRYLKEREIFLMCQLFSFELSLIIYFLRNNQERTKYL